MPRTRIKICGLRTEDAVAAAIDAGADALGFVFVPSSPRAIEPRDAWRLVRALPPMVHSVGLFVNPSPEDLADALEVCPTDYSQLHGQETEKTVRQCGPRIIKAVRYDPDTIEAELARWATVEEVDAILVDGSAGGQGQTLDWPGLARAALAAGDKPIVLAGGLTPDNVADAIRAVRPFAVDVSSGVEVLGEPGTKDPCRIRAFCNAVRAADAALGDAERI